MSAGAELGAGGFAEWSWRPSAADNALPVHGLFVAIESIGIVRGELPLAAAIEAASLSVAIARPGAVSVHIRHPKIKTRVFAFFARI